MTNREVLAKFILETFGIMVHNNFAIDCSDIYCPGFKQCIDCPGERINKDKFWDKEFKDNKSLTFNQYVANLESNVKYMDNSGHVLNPIINTKPVSFFEDQKEEKEETEESNEVTAFTSGEISW